MVQFKRGAEEEKAWIVKHLERARSPRPLLDVHMQLANIVSLFNVVASHRPLLQHVVDVGRTVLQRYRYHHESDVEAEISRLEAMWLELETAVRQQKERLEALSATDPDSQVIQPPSPSQPLVALLLFIL